MKGLLLKDFYMITKYCKAFALVVVVFFAVSLAGEDNLFFLIYPCMISGMIPVTLLSYDERSHWNVYSGVLPFTKAQLVSVKYIIGLLMAMPVLVLAVITQAIRMFMLHMFMPKETMLLMVILLAVACLAPALVLPFMFRFGTEKGRIAYYIIIAVLCSASLIVSNVFQPQASAEMSLYSVLAMLGGAVLLYVLSWLLSIRLYQRREI